MDIHAHSTIAMDSITAPTMPHSGTAADTIIADQHRGGTMATHGATTATQAVAAMGTTNRPIKPAGATQAAIRSTNTVIGMDARPGLAAPCVTTPTAPDMW
ncbi:MAG: hypothetical protein COA62_02245 [Rhodobiaceae bacterium]|nr:MAG: hypothetical protein COA62_02245 [Rhodobiaceae bacterium]